MEVMRKWLDGSRDEIRDVEARGKRPKSAVCRVTCDDEESIIWIRKE
jgi:hypothetical protein